MKNTEEEAFEEPAWFRLSYVTTMIFGIFNAQQKYLYGYDEKEYTHPMVRVEIFAEAVSSSYNASEDLKSRLLQITTDGWTSCLLAFNHLTLDVMQGKYGGFPEGCDFVPLQSLVYGRNDVMLLWKKRKEADEILLKTRMLLPIFKYSK